MADQRYVSDELTHFVGRGLPEERQYALLVDVLRSGLLAPEGQHVEGHLLVDVARPLSSNESYVPEAVCLCDIPLGDLHLHIAKYSPFGVAFPKTFLAERGASPIYYIAGQRAREWDRAAKEHHALRDLADREGGSELAKRVRDYLHFLDFQVYAYTKFFPSPVPDEAAENYYMEREWRLLGSLRFSHEDVRRVILPESYAGRFRKDFPDYAAQVTFSAR